MIFRAQIVQCIAMQKTQVQSDFLHPSQQLAPTHTGRSTRQKRTLVVQSRSSGLCGPSSPRKVQKIPQSPLIETWKDMEGNNRTTEWRNGIFTTTLSPFTGPEGRDCIRTIVGNYELITPIQCFRLFFTPFMARLMVK